MADLARRPRQPRAQLQQLSLERSRRDSFSLSETGTFSKGGFLITSAGIRASPLGSRELVAQVRHADLLVLRTLGQGASSVVKVARHTPSGKLVALKVLNMMGDAATREQAVNELRILGACACPHLLGFFGAFYADGALMIALPLARASLADIYAALRARAAARAQAGPDAPALTTGPRADSPPDSSGDALAAAAGLRLRGAAAQSAERARAIEATRRASASPPPPAPGPPVARALSPGEPGVSACLPERVLAALLAQALRGLHHLHTVQKTVHRDLKPENMLVAENGVLCLSDFGITKALGDTRAMATSFVGTAHYMAPERIRGGAYACASDVWSLGVVGLEGASGAHPFGHLRSYYDLLDAHSGDAELSIAAAAAAAGGPPLPPACAHFLQSCMRKRAADRPSAEQLLAHALIRSVDPDSGPDPEPRARAAHPEPGPAGDGGRSESEGGAEAEAEAEALRLGAVVRSWLDETQVELAPVATAADVAAAEARADAERGAAGGAPGPAPSAAPAEDRRQQASPLGRARQVSVERMGELELQLAQLSSG